jgi:glycosyltransferase involved in cell wall biosynthesis
MKVLHVDEQNTWRGGEQQASWLIQGLATAGHTVWLAGRPGAPFLTNAHGGVDAERVEVSLCGEFDFISARRLARAVREERIDIIHAHTSHAHAIACLTRYLAHRGHVVVSRRVAFAPKNHGLNRRKYSAPDRFISVSHKVDETLAAFGVPASKRRVVHSAVDLERLEAPALPRAELGVPEDAPLLVSAGALVGHKDHANLVGAFTRVRRTCPGAHLVIAGEGPLRRELEAQIAGEGLGSCIHLVGHRADAPRIIRAADIYVSSSWSEGLGTSILEALACATPVVATLAGGADEMVSHGVTGRLVPVRDSAMLAAAITETLHDMPQAKAMAQAGAADVRARFTAARMVAGNIAVYEELLAAPPGA